MKELKHLIYFESLLEDANNELVRKAGQRETWPSVTPVSMRRRCC